MSTTENGTKTTIRYDTLLALIRREAQKIRDANDRLQELKTQLGTTGHPAPAQMLGEATVAIHVALEHVRSVFREL